MEEMLRDYKRLDDVEFYEKYMKGLSGEEVMSFIKRFAELTFEDGNNYE